MKICIPIVENLGLLSFVSRHFGSAPMFLLIDDATLAFRSIPNPAPDEHNRCDPYRALDGHAIDAFIVGGIGANAFATIERNGVPVYRSLGGRVTDALTNLIAGKLPVLSGGTSAPAVGVALGPCSPAPVARPT